LISAGAPPQIPLGELTALPQAGFKEPTSKGREGRGRKGEREGKEWIWKKEREGGEREREGKGDRDGRESLGGKGKERERCREKGRKGKIRGPGPPMFFFLEPRLFLLVPAIKGSVYINTHSN